MSRLTAMMCVVVLSAFSRMLAETAAKPTTSKSSSKAPPPLPPLPPPFDPAVGPYPPLQPMECGAERTLVINNFVISSGEQITKTNLSGFKYFSLSSRATYLVTGGNEGNIPSSQIGVNLYDLADNSPLAAHKVDFVSQKCVNLGPGGAFARYEGYDYYRYIVTMLDQGMDEGIQVYYQTMPCLNPQDGNCFTYVWEVPTLGSTNSKAIQRTSIYFSTKSPNYLLYMLVQGTSLCCQDGSGCKQNAKQLCADGVEPVPTSRYEVESFTNYVKYNDDYTWPDSFFDVPACPSSFEVFTNGVEQTTPSPTQEATSAPSSESEAPASSSNNQPCKTNNGISENREEMIIVACLVPTITLFIFTVCYFCSFWAPKLVVEQSLDALKLHAHTLANMNQKGAVAPDASLSYNQRHFDSTKNEMHL